MTLSNKKYIVKVPTGKTSNNFQFDELLPAFTKYCQKVSQNQASKIESYQTTLDIPKVLSWGELLNDVMDQFNDCLQLIESIHTIPRDKDNHYLISKSNYEDFQVLNELMSHVGQAVWGQWDEVSKVYWKSCIPRMQMLLEESVITNDE